MLVAVPMSPVHLTSWDSTSFDMLRVQIENSVSALSVKSAHLTRLKGPFGRDLRSSHRGQLGSSHHITDIRALFRVILPPSFERSRGANSTSQFSPARSAGTATLARATPLPLSCHGTWAALACVGQTHG